MNADTSDNQQRDLDLIKKINSGDSEAIEILLGLYKGLVRYKASSMFMAGADVDDVIQEGMIGLFKAIRDYKPEYGLNFASFAGYCIASQITDAVRGASRQKHRPLNESISFQSSVGKNSEQDLQLQDLIYAYNQPDPEQQLLNSEQQIELQEFIKTHLSKFEYKVVLLYLEALPYQQISEFLDCSVKSVDNALGRVRRKLKNYQGDK